MSGLTKEAVAEILADHTIECTGLGEVTCRACRELSWMPWSQYRGHVANLIVALGAESSTPHSDDYLEGRQDIADAIRQDIAALKSSTPLVVEQRAYDKALAAVTARLGDS